MARAKEDKGIRLYKLTKDLSTLFLPVIRYRGKKYANNGRVKLDHISEENISATVFGSMSYKVSIDLKMKEEGAVRIGCTCPFFRQGIACKHIWATLVVAEKYFLKNQTRQLTSDSKQISALDLFAPGIWPDGEKVPWKPVQDFVLRYKVRLANDTIFVSGYEQYIKKDGNPGRKKKLKPNIVLDTHLPRQDRLILPFLLTLTKESSYGYPFYSYGDPFKDIQVGTSDAYTLLPLLAETGRCKVIDDKGNVVANPLKTVPNAEKAKFILTTQEEGAKKEIGLSPYIVINQEKHALKDLTFINSSPAFIIHGERLYEVEGPSYGMIKKLSHQKIIKSQKKELPHLVKQAIETKRITHLDLPEKNLPEVREDIDPFGGLVLEIKKNKIEANAFIQYDSLRIKVSEREELLFDEGNWVLIKRNKDLEARILGHIYRAGFTESPVQDVFYTDLERAQKALSFLEKKGFILEAQDGKQFRTGAIRSVNISSGIDWFDMNAEVSFGSETVPLPQVVAAYLNGKNTIRLGSGGVGILPSKWLERHRRMLEFAKRKKDERGNPVLRFPSSHALMIESLLEEQKEAQVDETFKRLRKRLNSFKGIKPVTAPHSFKGKLRQYQKDGLGWFDFLRNLGFGGILADDMGLGKTVQVLAWLDRLRQNGRKGLSLIVAPTSLVFNWQAEAKKFTPELKISSYVGSERKRVLDDLEGTDIILTTYGIVRRDIRQLLDHEFFYCILDESQYIKNPDSMTAKACRLLKARHKLCLTGTPIENHLGELWSQMEFLNPGILGSKSRYMANYAKPASEGDKEAVSHLKRLVRPFILRRTKEEVAKELPDKMETIVRCTMTKEQMELYSQVRNHYRSSIMQAVEKKGMNRSKMKVLEGLLRLRQAANHPALLGATDCPSGKFEQLLELLSEAMDSGHKVLIFSQFTKMLKLIKDELIKRNMTFEYLDGRTPQAKRKERVKKFQEDDNIRAFLISLKAGGFGLNLTAADYVFIVDPWWNPAVEVQAIDRTHRIGQTKKVVTYRLITKDSVEEKVLDLQEKKREIVGSILSGSKNLLKDLTPKDLEVLFS